MQNQMPQEIEVWYIIPALRRELAKSMIKDFKLTQRQVAGYMNLTEAAVSQYLSLKRAKEIIFSKAILEEIKISAKQIIENKASIVSEMIKLCSLTDVKHVMCSIHRKQDQKLHKKCEICFEDLMNLH